jgi:Domain of unknown function (DUF5979)
VCLLSIASVGVVATVAPAGAGEPKPEPNCKIPIQFVSREVDAEVAPPMEKPAHCATLEVTKVVTGTPEPSPPPGTEFSVVVDCKPQQNNNTNGNGDQFFAEAPGSVDSLPAGNKPPFTETLTFGPNGGTQNVLIAAKHAGDCTVSETAPPGCTLTSIDPEKTAIEEPIVYPVTVTNNCNPPPQPAGAEAAVAVAVVTAPRFTG